LFAEKRSGGNREGVPYVSSKDVNTAKQILAVVPMAEIESFLDYALAEARRTRFDVRTLGGVKTYVDGYVKMLQSRAAVKVATAATEQELQTRKDYDRFRRELLDRLFRALPPKEQEEIDASARCTALPTGRKEGFLARTLIEIERTRIVAARYPDRIPLFEQWRNSPAA
jgi:hypothetical protein